MNERLWTGADLALHSGLSKTTVSRILRDSNDKGGTYLPTDETIMALSIAFKLGRSGWEELLCAAFPERAIWFDGLDKRQDIFDVNDRLVKAKLPVIGSKNSE